MAVSCSRCGAKQGLLATLTADIGDGSYICPECKAEIVRERRAREEAERQRIEQIKQAAKLVIVTTTPKVDGYYVVK